MVSIVENAILDKIMDHLMTPDFERRLHEAANLELERIARLPKTDVTPDPGRIEKLKASRRDWRRSLPTHTRRTSIRLSNS